MAGELPVIIMVGAVGPAGTGVTAGDWNTLVSRVNALYSPAVPPIALADSRDGGVTINNTSVTFFGDPLVTVNLDVTKSVLVSAWATADITSPGSTVAYFGITLASGFAIGDYYSTPSGAGTYAGACGFSARYNAGALGSAFSLRVAAYLSAANNTTYNNVRLWCNVIQPG